MDDNSLPGWEWAQDLLDQHEYEEAQMSLTARRPDHDDFEMFPEGTHIVRCWRLVDLGTQDPPPDFKNQRPSEQILVSFEACEEKMENGEPFSINAFYTNILSRRSKLKRHLEAWRGKSFTDEELDGFELTNIVGTACMINVIHEKKEGSTDVRTKIEAIMALPKGTKAPALVNKPVVFSLEDATVNWDKLPEWLQERIMKSHEWTGKSQERGHLGVPEDDKAPGADVPFLWLATQEYVNEAKTVFQVSQRQVARGLL